MDGKQTNQNSQAHRKNLKMFSMQSIKKTQHEDQGISFIIELLESGAKKHYGQI